jgi:hypothetical protein
MTNQVTKQVTNRVITRALELEWRLLTKGSYEYLISTV